jgi:two-component system, chemotaxis family, sensor kinase CheA
MIAFENFQSRFVEEALDNINDLEQALLELELSPGNKDLLEKVFRVMHSLKGGGAMFGFDKLSEFTHRMENIYDLVRSEKLIVSPKLLSVTLKSVDMLRILLEPDQMALPQFEARYKQLSAGIDEIVKEETQSIIASATHQQFTKTTVTHKDDIGKTATWFIHFYPERHVMEHGTNILFLLDELKTSGKLFAIPGTKEVPSLDELNPEQSFLYWDLFLSTNQGKDTILDTFIFVEDESIIEIHKISDKDLFENNQFTQRMEELKTNQGEIELSDITEFIVANDINCYDTEEMTSLYDSEHSATSVAPSEEKQGRSLTSIRVSSEKIDGLMNLVSELVITQERLNLISSRHQIPELKMVTESVQKLTGMLRDSTFSISLIPIETMITRFQRLVRDLSCQLGKKITFTATGTETELDKSMIENLIDPLLHIIRNSIDHGIETPEIRKRKGKPETGKISLHAAYSGANVIIQIKDDGAGIDPSRIRAKAIEKCLIANDNQHSDSEILDLVFLPGFSTTSKVTEVSGRGVGMDVVKRNISAIRGEVGIDSEPEKGTTITITLPLVLSIIDGLLVQINSTQYIIPLALTDRIYSVDSQLLKGNFTNTITLNATQYPFFNLRNELCLNGEVPKRSQMVVVNHSDTQIAIAVDKVVGKIQAVLKPLGRMYHNQKVISAATIMGDGSIALVLDTNAIIKELYHHA